MAINRLTERHLRVADRMLAFLLAMWGYGVSLAMVVDTAGWDDPVFTVVRKIPFTPYSWAAVLFVFISVYIAGEVADDQRSYRGRLIITGSILCMFWHLGFSICMARMVYLMPTRITNLWPLAMFFVACMFATRVISYANAFSGERWNTNPYQLWSTMSLLIVSLSQVIVQIAPTSILTQIEKPVAFQVVGGNFLGAAVVMFGLHMRNKELGVNLELAGAMSLLATMIWYAYLVLHEQNIAAIVFNFGLTIAFVFATLHRGIQILTLKWARYRNNASLENKMAKALTNTSLEGSLETKVKREP